MVNKEQTLQIFKNSSFQKFAKSESIDDVALRKAVKEIESGLIHANLGENLFKQRIRKPDRGKSGGYRSIIVYKKDDKAFFVYGFDKKKKENLAKHELAPYKKAAKYLLELSDTQIQQLIDSGEIVEVK